MNSEADTTPAVRCEALMYGLRMAAAQDASLAAYEQASKLRDKGDVSQSIYTVAEARLRLDEELAFKAALACVEARSLEGAAFQITEVLNLINVFDDDHESEDGPDIAPAAARRAIVRLLYSVLHAIQKHCDQPIDAACRDIFNWHLDPWRTLDERLTVVSEGTAAAAS